MRKICVTLTATLAVVGAMAGGRAYAAVTGPNALKTAVDELAPVETVQFSWRGRRFCWYDTGWRGPGWYECGFRWRRGLGWGGPIGWRGWRRPGITTRNRPGINRPDGNRPGTTGQGGRPGGNRPGMSPGGSNRPGGGGPGVGAVGGRPGGGGPGGGGPGRRGGQT